MPCIFETALSCRNGLFGTLFSLENAAGMTGNGRTQAIWTGFLPFSCSWCSYASNYVLLLQGGDFALDGGYHTTPLQPAYSHDLLLEVVAVGFGGVAHLDAVVVDRGYGAPEEVGDLD